MSRISSASPSLSHPIKTTIVRPAFHRLGFGAWLPLLASALRHESDSRRLRRIDLVRVDITGRGGVHQRDGVSVWNRKVIIRMALIAVWGGSVSKVVRRFSPEALRLTGLVVDLVKDPESQNSRAVAATGFLETQRECVTSAGASPAEIGVSAVCG